MNTEQLEQFRDPTKKSKKIPWKEPAFEDFRPGYVIAFDPSLSATGVVALSFEEETGFRFYAAKKFPNPAVGAVGYEESFRKGQALTVSITQWRQQLCFSPETWAYAHEAPPVGGGRMRSPESTLLAGMAVRHAMGMHQCLGLVPPQAHKMFICGNSKADKKEHHRYLNLIRIKFDLDAAPITNEATRDALSIALYALRKDYGTSTR